MKDQVLIEQIESCIRLAEKSRDELERELEEIASQADRAWTIAEAYARTLGSFEASIYSIKQYVEWYKEDNKYGNI